MFRWEILLLLLNLWRKCTENVNVCCWIMFQGLVFSIRLCSDFKGWYQNFYSLNMLNTTLLMLLSAYTSWFFSLLKTSIFHIQQCFCWYCFFLFQGCFLLAIFVLFSIQDFNMMLLVMPRCFFLLILVLFPVQNLNMMLLVTQWWFFSLPTTLTRRPWGSFSLFKSSTWCFCSGKISAHLRFDLTWCFCVLNNASF